MIKRYWCLLLALFCLFAFFGCDSPSATDTIPPAPDLSENEDESPKNQEPTLYTIPNGCFEAIDYEWHEGESTDGELPCFVTLYSRCAYALSSHTVRVDIYADNGALLYSDTYTVNESTPGDVTFTDRLPIPAVAFEEGVRLSLLYEGTSEEAPQLPSGTSHQLQKCTVRFIIGSSEYHSLTVMAGERLTAPKEPQRDGAIFAGWYTTEALSRAYDFSAAVSGELTLYAKFIPDAASLINDAAEKLVPSILTVTNTCYKSGVTETCQGSGVIFKVDGENCYLLTNCHVARLRTGYTDQRFVVEDAYGNIYEAELYRDPDTKKSAISADYDLAVLHFRATKGITFRAVTFGEAASIGDTVIAVGAPGGLRNTVTIGTALSYSTTSLSTDSYLSNVTFPVLFHTAPIDHGSSGGALFNSAFELVGINYAGISAGATGAAVPIYRVEQFLAKYMPDTDR